MATINQAVPTRLVTIDPGGYYYFNRYATVSVTNAYTVPVPATEEGSKSGVIDGIKEGTSETFTGFIKHDVAQPEPNGEVTYPGFAIVYPGGKILTYTIEYPEGVHIRSGGTGYTFISFGKNDWGSSGSTDYSISITYATGTYGGADTGTWEHPLTRIIISNGWCSSGRLEVATNSNGYTARVISAAVNNPRYSFDYSGEYESTITRYYGTGSMQYYGDIMSVTTNFGSVSYSTRYGTTINVNVTANSSGKARVTANLRAYRDPDQEYRANVRFTGYYANGTKANNVLANYVNFNGERYP